MKGKTIRKRLEQMRIKQVELARLLGITPQAVSGIFAASDVRTGTVERICEVLNLPVTFFYNDVPDNVANHSETERDCEIQYLRGQVAAYETAFTNLRLSIGEVAKAEVFDHSY